MKKLQNNFTTPEQSKRLLELGLPADSADCFWFDERDLMFLKDILYSDEAKDGEWVRATDYTPCWSVGRLIEIMNICSIWGNVSIHRTDREVTQIEQLIEILQNRINGKTIDLSKLEE